MPTKIFILTLSALLSIMLGILFFRGSLAPDPRTAVFPETAQQQRWMQFFCKDPHIQNTPEGDLAACTPCPQGHSKSEDDLLLFDGVLEFRVGGDAWALLLVQGCGAETQGSKGATLFLKRSSTQWSEVDRLLGNHTCALLREGREALFFCESTELQRGINETRWEALQIPSLKRSTLFSFTSQDDVMIDEVVLQSGEIVVHSGGSTFVFHPDKSGWRPSAQTESLIQSLIEDSEQAEPTPEDDPNTSPNLQDSSPQEA
jgi:hypothetical protein